MLFANSSKNKREREETRLVFWGPRGAWAEYSGDNPFVIAPEDISSISVRLKEIQLAAKNYGLQERRHVGLDWVGIRGFCLRQRRS